MKSFPVCSPVPAPSVFGSRWRGGRSLSSCTSEWQTDLTLLNRTSWRGLRESGSGTKNHKWTDTNANVMKYLSFLLSSHQSSGDEGKGRTEMHETPLSTPRQEDLIKITGHVKKETKDTWIRIGISDVSGCDVWWWWWGSFLQKENKKNYPLSSLSSHHPPFH